MILTAFPVGFFAGLFGIGGGLITVPFLFFIFEALGVDKIKFTKLNSIRDNSKFNIDAVKILYSLPVNSFTLINDENNNIYLAKTLKYKNKPNDISDDNSQEYKNKHGSENKSTLLKTYDLFLNNKYDIVLNQKTIERVKNFFQ